MTIFAITGASGQLGRLAVDALLARVDPGSIVALVRDPATVADFAERGVIVRKFDYDAEETLAPGLAGVDRLLLISSNELGQRARKHQAVIDAASDAGVGFIAYTSILHADGSPLGLAVEHRATEAVLRASGLPHALLRNGWYFENYTAAAGQAIAHGAVLGSTGEGRISAASRADYAAAAVAVLTGEVGACQVYELAGDDSFTLADLAAALAGASGQPVAYVDLPEAGYREALEKAGLPAPVAAMLAESSAKAAGGALADDSHTLSGLIGRPTQTLAQAVAAAVG